MTRADLAYQELSPTFRDQLLKAAIELGDTAGEILDLLYGRQITIDHGRVGGRRVMTRYAHLSRIHPSVRVGAYVAQGRVIGFVGNSGTSHGARGTQQDAHLHFEIWINGRYLGEGMGPSEVGKLLNLVFRQ